MHVTIDTDDTAALTTSWRIQATAVARCSILSLSSTGVCRESTESWPLSSSKEESSFTFSVDEDSDIFVATFSRRRLVPLHKIQLLYKSTRI